MAQAPLSIEDAKAALEAFAAHGSKIKAAAALGLPPSTYTSRLTRARGMDLSAPPPEPPPKPEPPPPELLFEDAWQKWMRSIGMARDKYAGPPPVRPAGSRLRVIAAGDFHVPFHDREAVSELIAREAADTDILMIGGDFGDCYSASVFTKYEQVPFREEMAETQACLQMLSEAFQQIVYLRGSNHMDRVEKRLREALHQDLLDAVLSMTGGELSPDLVMVKRYPNVKIGDWTTPTGQRVGWLHVIGDVAFSHAEKYSILPGAAMRKVEEWLDDFSGTLGLPPIRAVVQFHTHAMALLPWRADRVLIEPGCMCLQHQYQLGSKIGGRPQRVGYVRFEIEDGRIDFDSIRLRWINRRGREDVA